MMLISVKLKPSLLLGILLMILLLAVGGVVISLLLGQWGPPIWFVLPAFVPALVSVTALVVVAVLLVGLFAWQSRSVFDAYGITISATGQILLGHRSADAVPVQLLSDSTLWPNCMLLRFQCVATGRLYSVPVLPDSIGRAQFRALLVACRWLEARHGLLDREKILW